MYREHMIELDEPAYEDLDVHDHKVCPCEYCRPDEWPPVEGL
jgi:hypothetical protein